MLESLREVCLPCVLVVGAVAYFRNQNDPLLTCNMTRLKVDMRTSEEECRVVQNNFFRQTTHGVVSCSVYNYKNNIDDKNCVHGLKLWVNYGHTVLQYLQGLVDPNGR